MTPPRPRHRQPGSRPCSAWGALLCLAVIASLGCHTPFSRAFRENHQLQPSDLRRIQFYTSDTILLRRVRGGETRRQLAGSLDIHSKVEVEEVEIDAGTPGVAVRVHGEYIGVSFSRGDTQHLLWFSSVDASTAGQYALTHVTDYTSGDGAQGRPGPQYSPGYFVRYGAHDYRLVEPADWNVHLLFDDDVTLDRVTRQQQPAGWALSDSSPP